ncbi:hypothetical protein TWF506_006960 [Arthrobotrys conoides]|uniref:G-protein coupled receptors family 2 profile 2 domain-containing protein n=1 Tax=Arthrobotrys conoides TaxID=74498 RepID=A0AAN8RW35_9PEZI
MASGTEFLVSRTVDIVMDTPTSWLTPVRVKMMNDMSAILAGISLLLCLSLLGFILVLYLNPESRKCLDRVSFRLICYSLISNCFYCIGYIICVEVKPGFFCVAGVWMIQFWLGITNWLITCVALNLELVLVHLCNGIFMEKYYIIGTIVINLGTTLPPLIKGKFGWDDVIGVCWLTSDNNEDRLKWQISTQLLWILLAVLITCTCCCTTVFHLYRHKFTALNVLTQNKPSPNANITNSTIRSSSPDNRESTNLSATRNAQKSLLSNQEFRSIILRISLYPAVMIILNLVITIADIRISILSGIYSQGDYALYAVYYALYGARGIFYALIGVMDPSLQRAYHVWRGERMNSTVNGTVVGNGTIQDPNDPEIGDLSGFRHNLHENLDFGKGINVQTEIVREVIETKGHGLDFSGGSDIPMAVLSNGHVTTTTTIIEANNKFDEDGRQTFFLDSRASLDENDEPQPSLPSYSGPLRRDDGKRATTVTHWTDLRSDYELSMNEAADDSGSEANLALGGVAVGKNNSGESIDYLKGDVEEIRLRQRVRAQQRRLLEREMKRQI